MPDTAKYWLDGEGAQLEGVNNYAIEQFGAAHEAASQRPGWGPTGGRWFWAVCDLAMQPYVPRAVDSSTQKVQYFCSSLATDEYFCPM